MNLAQLPVWLVVGLAAGLAWWWGWEAALNWAGIDTYTVAVYRLVEGRLSRDDTTAVPRAFVSLASATRYRERLAALLADASFDLSASGSTRVLLYVGPAPLYDWPT